MWTVTVSDRRSLPVVLVVSAGGATGALGRYALAVAWPASPGRLPWATLVTNVVGCLLIGMLMVLITEVWGSRRLIRPFLGVGVLGGFTTFSTYVVDVQHLVAARAPGVAMVYLVGTPLTALLAVMVGVLLGRWAVLARGCGE